MIPQRALVGGVLVVAAIGLAVLAASWTSCETTVNGSSRSTTCGSVIPSWLTTPLAVGGVIAGSFLAGQAYPPRRMDDGPAREAAPEVPQR